MKKLKISIGSVIVLFLLLGIILISYKSRTPTVPDIVSDYDPWWFYRHAKALLDNNLIPPKWDLLSFFPPGRPFPNSPGWAYTIVIFYKILNLFTKITFMKAAILSPAIMTALGIIPAYFLGKELTNGWGGLSTAILSAMTPTFIGVSMAGYLDTDVVVVFYSFLSLLAIFALVNKKKPIYIIPVVLTSLVFIYSWWFGWYILLFFSLMIPVYFAYKVIEDLMKKERKIHFDRILKDLRNTFSLFVVALIITNVIAIIIGLGNIINFVFVALGFRMGQGLLVNVSVAELQPINIFTKGGFNVIASRLGYSPYFPLVGMLIIIAYKFYKKESIRIEDLFLFLWSAITFYTIINGVRFSLQFSIAMATAAGYVIGNATKYVQDKDLLIKSSVFGISCFFILTFISQTYAFALNTGGFGVGQNWIDMLDWLKNNADPEATVATWWDPGHIIAGYTDLHVVADGAHCAPSECIPYSHNVRIQDMGRIMSTNDEKTAIELLQKYMKLTPEDCQKVKDKFGNIVPEEACKSASEMYFISSSDLIGKFTWMNYFGGFRAPIASNQDFLSNPGVCCASTPETESEQISCGEFANQGRGVWIWCPWIFNYEKTQQDQEGNNIYIYDYSGLKLAIIQKPSQLIPVYNNRFVITRMSFFDQSGSSQNIDLSGLNTTLEKIDGLVWVQSDFRSLIYFAPAIRDSIFVRTFFYDGEGLEHFQLVYKNSEIRLYKVIF